MSELREVARSLCAARGLDVADSELMQLIEFVGRDTRRLLNALQCWAM